jgi:AcrR family transcriptional regulator
MSRPSRKTEIKERVLSAALQLIAEGGFQQSPMSKLAQLAKVSVGSIYLYFPSKDALIISLFEDVRKDMEEYIFTKYNPKGTLPERYDGLFLAICHYYLEHKKHFVFMDQFALSAYNTTSLDAFSEEIAKAVLTFYKDGVGAGVLKNVSIDIMISLTHGSIVSLIKKHHMGFSNVDRKALNELKDCVWQGISKH